MKVHVLEREQRVHGQLSAVFAFFADAANLERLTPPSLSFRILTRSPIDMRTGTLIDYRLALFGVPFRWRTRIESFVPGRSFVDLQLKGPYRLWRHTHEFFDLSDGSTRVTDHVEYALPLGPLGEIAHAAFVERQLRTIFDYRRETIAKIFPTAAPSAGQEDAANV